jgi:hypothetical protein
MPIFRERELSFMLGLAESKIVIVPKAFRDAASFCQIVQASSKPEPSLTASADAVGSDCNRHAELGRRVGRSFCRLFSRRPTSK